MAEVAVARLWQLANGTSCVLLKDSRAANWELRVLRGSDIIRSEYFGSPLVAMDAAKAWCAYYDGSREP
jgi:hypothetical protein